MAGFDKAALERLMALGRKRGHLTTGDLESELPVGGMEPDEIALIIVHLEEAGIPVEVDAGLLTGERRPTALPPDGGLVLPSPPAEAPPALFAGAEGAAAPVSPAAAAGPAPAPGRRYAHVAVAIGGIAALLVLVALLALVPSS